MDDIETMIHEKGADVAPRITPAHVESQISAEVYFRGTDHSGITTKKTETALSCLTICVLALMNGFTIVGKSACASPENYNEEIGRRIAREDAVRQIWALEGYQLRTRLAVGPVPTEAAA